MIVFLKKMINIVFGICLVIISIYLMTLITLYTTTDLFYFNILKYNSFKELIVFSAIVLPITIIIRILIKRFSHKDKLEDINEK